MKIIPLVLCFVFAAFIPVHAQDASAPVAAQPTDQAGVPADTQAAAAPAVAETPTVPAPVAGEKRELILKFIDVFGTKRTMEQNLQAMFDDMGPNDPQAKKFKENVRVDEIIEQLIPLYDKNFTEDQLKAFIAFYSSPEGKKLLDTIPVLMRDSVDISAKYFEAKFPAEKAAADKAVSDKSEPLVEPPADKAVTP